MDIKSLTVEKVSIKFFSDFIQAHYLGKRPAIVTLSMGLFENGWARGIICFALPPIQTNIRYGCKTWEFARMWVDDIMPRNTETFFIARCIRYIKKNHPDVKMLVTYADPSAGHTGTVYRAANWTFDGYTDGGRKPRQDYISNGRKYSRRSHIPKGQEYEKVDRVSKARFIYPL